MSDTKLTVMSEPVRRIEVFTGAGRRRRWPDEVKARIVAESCRPGETVCAVAHRHGLTPQQLFTWRRQARHGELVVPEDVPLFAEVVAAPDAGMMAGGAAEIVVEVGAVRMRISPAVTAERVAALVSALRRAG